MKKEDLKKKITIFRDGLKDYRKVYLEILENKYNAQKKEDLLEKEEQLREELTEEWGQLERMFKKIGAPMITVIPSIGYPTHFFDEALSAQIFDNPHKYRGLEDAISSATKVIGLVDALTDIEFKKLTQKTPILFISYSFKEENEKLVRIIKDFLEAYPISITTGAKPSTGSLSEKVKKLIDDSDYVLAVLTKDEEQKDKSWTPSKWVFDEIAYASGKGKTVIRLLEKGTNYKAAISGDAEYINFEKNNLTGAFIKLAHILNSLLK